jgi:hypothetical protein
MALLSTPIQMHWSSAPTGVGLGREGVPYVAASNGNRIAAIANALFRTTVLHGGGTTVSQSSALNDPLGLTIAPNGDILSVNGGDGNIVETTPAGATAATKTLIPDGASDLFGLALAPHDRGVYFVNGSTTPPARQPACRKLAAASAAIPAPPPTPRGGGAPIVHNGLSTTAPEGAQRRRRPDTAAAHPRSAPRSLHRLGYVRTGSNSRNARPTDHVSAAYRSARSAAVVPRS